MEPGGLCRQSPGSADTVAVSRRCAQPHRAQDQAGKTRFGALNATTWGYNGSLLGPALQLTQGKTVTVDITNQLAEETTLHWHGLEVPGEVDGGHRGLSRRVPPAR